MADDERDLDAAMRQALAGALPTDEPPIGIEVGDVMRRGRRKYRARRAIPVAAAAAVAALLVAIPLSTGVGGSSQDHVPLGDPTGTTPSTSTVDLPDPESSSATGAPEPEFRMPAGHRRDEDADVLTDTIVRRLHAGRVTADFGTRSDRIASGDRYGFGFHMLWREGGRYGYLAVLHRTRGDFPASVYGMPAEPCTTPATRRPEYHCVPVTVPEGDVAYSYEITEGYRVRGIVWDKQDPAGGEVIRITGVFFVPEPGGWTPFRAMDEGPLLTGFPLTVEELGKVIGIPR